MIKTKSHADRSRKKNKIKTTGKNKPKKHIKKGYVLVTPLKADFKERASKEI